MLSDLIIEVTLQKKSIHQMDSIKKIAVITGIHPREKNSNTAHGKFNQKLCINTRCGSD